MVLVVCCIDSTTRIVVSPISLPHSLTHSLIHLATPYTLIATHQYFSGPGSHVAIQLIAEVRKE
jgi:hypothetical protein